MVGSRLMGADVEATLGNTDRSIVFVPARTGGDARSSEIDGITLTFIGADLVAKRGNTAKSIALGPSRIGDAVRSSEIAGITLNSIGADVVAKRGNTSRSIALGPSRIGDDVRSSEIDGITLNSIGADLVAKRGNTSRSIALGPWRIGENCRGAAFRSGTISVEPCSAFAAKLREALASCLTATHRSTFASVFFVEPVSAMICGSADNARRVGCVGTFRFTIIPKNDGRDAFKAGNT